MFKSTVSVRSLFAYPLILVLSIFATGCAMGPERPIPFSPGTMPSSMSPATSKVGVMVEEIPSTDTSFPGADCPLCMIAASVMHQGLTDRVRELDHEDLDGVGTKLISYLKERNIDARHIPAMAGENLVKFKGDSKVSPTLDYRALSESQAIDKLLVVRIHGQGVIRPMSSYVPNDIPKAFVKGLVFLVDLQSNQYEWYLPFDHRLAATGVWKEPPNYPGLTNAYYKNLVRVSDGIVAAFIQPDK